MNRPFICEKGTQICHNEPGSGRSSHLLLLVDIVRDITCGVGAAELFDKGLIAANYFVMDVRCIMEKNKVFKN